MAKRRQRRICVECGEPLGDQRFYHESAKLKAKDPDHSWRWACRGPSKMDTPLRAVSRAPMHLRFFASGRETVCGLVPGNVKGRYKNNEAQVTWSRVRVDMDRTTCPECIAMVIAIFQRRLGPILKQTGRSHKDVMENAETRVTANRLGELVDAR